MLDKIPITKEGYQKLLQEHEHLKKVELPAIIKKVAEARSHGDLKENAEYHAAREKQSYIQSRIQYLEDRIARSEIIAGLETGDTIIFGCTVKIIDMEDGFEEEYTLVGPDEADPSKGKISTSSPIGKALIGKKKGDIVEVETPGGIIKLKIEDFS